MTQDDVGAFYELLDEYFESRKELFSTWVNAGAAPAQQRIIHAPVPVAAPSPRLTAPPPPVNHRTSPAPAAAPSPTLASEKPAKPAPPNKGGVTLPSMSDLQNPKFQAGFKFAGQAASAAGGLLNKHVLGGGQQQQQQQTQSATATSSGGAAVPPAPAKSSSFAGKAFGKLQKDAGTPQPFRASLGSPKPQTPPARGIGFATAQYDYQSAEPGDLPFREGERITLLAKESADWWRGEVNGREGLFPANYVVEGQ